MTPIVACRPSERHRAELPTGMSGADADHIPSRRLRPRGTLLVVIDAETSPLSNRNRRLAQVAHILAQAVRDGELMSTDALRIIKHELRQLNTNKAQKIPVRSMEAQRVIDTYGAVMVPKNGSPDALHADHVHPLTEDDLSRNNTLELWINELPRLQTVVCITAAENYRLEVFERDGPAGPDKYAQAGVTFTTHALPWVESQ